MYKNYIVKEDGVIISKYTGSPLYIHTNKKGYQFVRLYVNGKSKTYLVHRIVAEIYVPNTEMKPEVNHKDGNKGNNHKDNLEWVTAQENVAHSVKNNLIKRGKERPNSKLTDANILEMRQMRAEGYNYYELGKKFGVAYQTAHKVCSRQTYTHI